MSEPIRDRWIASCVRGKTFAEVGGLWGVVNEQVSVAANAGAAQTTMIDTAPDEPGGLWEQFKSRLKEHEVSGTTFAQGNIDNPKLVASLGSFDVVHCSGVLYHCPEPLKTLRHLRRITSGKLILGTATIPEEIAVPAGRLHTSPGSALLTPALSTSQRAILGEWLMEVGAVEAVGVNAMASSAWELNDYGLWWWFFTRDYVNAMLEIAGFNVTEVASYWNGRATFYAAEAI